MSTANITSPKESETEELLKRLGRFVWRANLIAASRFVLIGLAGWMAFVCAVMAADYFSDLPAATRWWCGRASVAITLAAIGMFCLRAIQTTSTGKLASQIDQSQRTGGQITTGWDLLCKPDATYSALTASFAEQAIRKSSQQLAHIKPSAVLPLAAAKRPAVAVLTLLLGMALLYGVFPQWVLTQWKRLAFPASDTPLYTGISIRLDKTNHMLRYGDDVKIMATITRKPRDRLELVTLTQDGRERVLPMLPRGESNWQALLTDIKEPAQFFARSGRIRSETGQLEVQLTPNILESLVRITPLEYTRQAVYEGKIPDAGIAGLVGTQVELFLKSNRPLKAGRLKIIFEDKSERSIELVPASAEDNQANRVVGQMALERSGTFEATVTDIDGLQSTDRVRGKIEILVDQRPIVRILEPRQFSMATPDIDLPISISAEDDFGITQLRLYRSLNGSPSRSLDLPTEPSPRANAVWPLRLKQLGLVPGDEIALFARTEDNDPSGPKGAESPTTTIRIISIEEFQERMLEQRGAEALSAKYEAAQRQLENVSTAVAEAQAAAERAAADPDNAALQKELQEKLNAAEKAAKDAAAAIKKLAQNPMDIDIDRELSNMLKELAEETSQSAEQLKQLSQEQAGQKPLTQSQKEQLDALREKTKSDRDELQEDAIDPLNELSKTLPLMQDKERFDELVEQQKQLAERMQSLADADPNDPSNERRMMEMEAAQEELRQELNELADRMQENADQLPDTEAFQELKESAQQLAEGMKQSGAPELMNDAQKSLLKSKFKQAAENAKAAADALDALLPDNGAMGQAAEGKLQGAFQKPGKLSGPKMGRTLEQLKQRMKQKGQSPGAGQGGSQPGEPGGESNGYSTRSPRPQNTGMYGSMPTPSPSSRGRSDKVSQGAATQSAIAKRGSGNSETNAAQTSDASGQSQQSVPTQYRQRVSDYYRRIQEMLVPE